MMIVEMGDMEMGDKMPCVASFFVLKYIPYGLYKNTRGKTADFEGREDFGRNFGSPCQGGEARSYFS